MYFSVFIFCPFLFLNDNLSSGCCSWMLQNVSSGPYLCPKHTKCHSCSSTVPGNGLSVRYSKLTCYLQWVFESEVNLFSYLKLIAAILLLLQFQFV